MSVCENFLSLMPVTTFQCTLDERIIIAIEIREDTVLVLETTVTSEVGHAHAEAALAVSLG